VSVCGLAGKSSSIMAARVLMLHAAAAAGAADAASQPWFDVKLPRTERVAALVDAMALDEKIDQLVVNTPSIPRLGVPAYHWCAGWLLASCSASALCERGAGAWCENGH
jgi:hypothetical protein